MKNTSGLEWIESVLTLVVHNAVFNSDLCRRPGNSFVSSIISQFNQEGSSFSAETPVNLKLEALVFLVTESNFMIKRYRIADLNQPVNLLTPVLEKNAVLSQQTSIYYLLESKCGSCSFNKMKPQNCNLLSLGTTQDNFSLEDTLIITVCPKCHTETLEKRIRLQHTSSIIILHFEHGLTIKTFRKMSLTQWQ